MKHVHLYVLDTFADWEPGYLLAELNTGRYLKGGQKWPIKTVAVHDKPVQSMGGLTVTPDLTLSDLRPEDSRLLILPGADTWAQKQQQAVVELATEFLKAGVPVAAICGATIALAQAGLLDERPHTSNDLGALRHLAPAYQGGQHYRQQPVVQDGNLLTASGVAPAQFAAATLRMLDAMTPEVADAWLDLNTRQDPQAFYTLMELMQDTST